VIGPIPDLDSARNQVAEGGFDVAILDINLHGYETYRLADELRGAGTPFLFATGYSEKVIPVRFRDAIRWEKPYELDKVVGDVRRLCSLAAM
jgi:DNA-binding response OmpR family regulator